MRWPFKRPPVCVEWSKLGMPVHMFQDEYCEARIGFNGLRCKCMERQRAREEQILLEPLQSQPFPLEQSLF